MAQRLSTAQSAYLRQHAENPVDWWPWGREAFIEAARRDVPVFVSIGYAACHWCHVMAHESFEDERVAALLNQRFVSIKVDREEHPDVDDAYTAATQAMTGQGGWPMSVFTLPDGRVFHTGTYFPPQRRGPLPSFTEVLHAVHEAWTQRREQVQQQAVKISEALGRQRRRQAELATVVQTQNDDDAAASTTGQDRAGAEGYGAVEGGQRGSAGGLAELTEQVLAALVAEEDPVHGGFDQAPKFPPSPLLGWLLEESAWRLRPGKQRCAAPSDEPAEASIPARSGPSSETKDQMRDTAPADRAGGLAAHTMEAMARSALFDQVEGGFARYATDRAWQLPHFEKMLYDNAQLLGAYARLSAHPAADAQAQANAARTARMTIDWLRSRMLTDQGLLASSLDADTVGEDGSRAEGATYLFSDDQLLSAAQEAGLSDAEAQRLTELNHGVPADEHALRSGESLPITAETPRTLHFDEPLSGTDLQLWEAVLPPLREIRSARAQPARDDKVVAAWNAQAVSSLAQAAALWNDPQLLEFAEALAERLWEVHAETLQSAPPRGAEGRVDELGTELTSVERQDGSSAKIYRTSYEGRRGNVLGTLSDHAQIISMCCALASAGADGPTWLDRSGSVLRFVLSEFVTATDETVTVLEALDADGLLTLAQGGDAQATPVDGPEPSSIAALAQALQSAEALGLIDDLPLPDRSGAPGNQHSGATTREGLRPSDILQHLQLIGPQAPLAVGGSLLAARRTSQGSPAFRVFSGRAEDIAEARRVGVLLGIPVEPLGDSVVGPDQQLQVSICLNGETGGVCLAPADSVEGALESL